MYSKYLILLLQWNESTILTYIIYHQSSWLVITFEDIIMPLTLTSESSRYFKWQMAIKRNSYLIEIAW